MWGDELRRIVEQSPELGLRFCGAVGVGGQPVGALPGLGTIQDMEAVTRDQRVEAFFLALDERESHLLPEIMGRCVGLDVGLYLVPDALELLSRRIRVEHIDGVPVLSLKGAPIEGWGAIGKRAFDVVVSVVALVVLSPVFALIAVALKVASRGPVLHQQARVGMDGRGFVMLKFRSMVMDAEEGTGPGWTVRDDPRVTRVGRVLRRFCLDELPQLVNVIRGEMSLVGPRPERESFVREFTERLPAYLERHRVKSGITGWAQVNGCRGNTPIAPRVRYDVYYIENWSFLLDLKILALTVWVVLSGRGSY